MKDQKPETYTTKEAMQALGVNARSALHHLRKQYPKAFLIVQTGKSRHIPTLYDKATLDAFITWRSQDWKG